MLFRKIKTPGLSQLSYMVGSAGEAAVIDPRRDVDIYVDEARANDLAITHIFETHRNEDLVSGAPLLSELTGAPVHHGPNAAGEVVYARTVRDGARFSVGDLDIEVLETPGHTDDHLAFALYDRNYPEGAVGVFTGDALFVGDVGRTDFYPDRAEEVAGLLFDSLKKILALGDQAILWPAHGAGSVCGSGMADREESTLGHERLNNPMLAYQDRATFIRAKTGETHYQPPYFRLMERLNLEGAPPPWVRRPLHLSLSDLESLEGVIRLDIRSPNAFAAGHFPGSFCIPAAMIPAFAGWFIGPQDRLALIAESDAQLEEAATHLMRIGLDNIEGGYVGLVEAVASGRAFSQLPMIGVEEVKRRLEAGADGWTLLDVRAADEVEEASIEGAEHIYAGHLNERWSDLDPNRAYTVMCASGMRATIAASWLKKNGLNRVDVFLGSMGAWQSQEA